MIPLYIGYMINDEEKVKQMIKQAVRVLYEQYG